MTLSDAARSAVLSVLTKAGQLPPTQVPFSSMADIPPIRHSGFDFLGDRAAVYILLEAAPVSSESWGASQLIFRRYPTSHGFRWNPSLEDILRTDWEVMH